MPQFPINRRMALLLVAGAVIVILGAMQFAKLADDKTLLRPYDFVEYWCAGRLLLDGSDPYDPDRLVPMQKAMHDGVIKAVMMWNPPWTLPLTLPFAALPWRLAQFLWLFLQLAALLVSADLLWRMYDGSSRYRWVSWAITLTFAPSLFLLFMGQISGLVLLGVAGFLWFFRNDRPIAAGCLAALTAIKPHHLSVFALILAFEAVRHKPIRKAVIAGAIVLLIASVVPLLWNSHVWSQYGAALRRTPSDTFESMEEFEQSTIGYRLRMVLPGQPIAAQFIPMLIALIVMTIWWWRAREPWSWQQRMPLLTLIAVLATPYGAWAFDMVLLLAALVPMAVWVLASRSKWLIGFAAGIFLLLNALTLETIRHAGSQANPWIAPIVFASYITITIATNRIGSKPLAVSGP